jgi:N-acetylglutamate synthase/N-acetylornithine aminotransferase
MKKVLLLVFLGILSRANAQMVVSDPVNTKLLVISNGIQSAMKSYSDLQTNIQRGTLSTVVQSTGMLSQQLDLINSALDVADQFTNAQSTRDFFIRQRNMVRDINSVTSDYFSIGAGILSPVVRGQIRQDLDDATILATKSLSVVSSGFVRKQLNLSERLAFIMEAQRYLDNAQTKIASALYLVNTKRKQLKRLDEANKLYKIIF